MQNNLLYKIALSKVKGLGPVLCRNLITYLGDPEAVFKEKRAALEKIQGVGTKLANEILNTNALDAAKRELDFISKHQIGVSFFIDKQYPQRLKQCCDAPIILYHKGNHNLSSRKMLAVVGTRKVTENGKHNCRKIIEELSQKFPELTIVSGLAYGVDIHAHRAALEFGLPTIGVLAHGLDRLYPSMHRSTAQDLQKTGALVTDFTSGTNPDKQNFVKRNRIVAGLCDATLVVESAAKGGSLLTAHMAQSYNRDVLAFPGRVDDEYSKGCNHLIKSNIAALVESAKDIEYALNWEAVETKGRQLNLFQEPEGEQGIIYELIRQEKEISVSTMTVKTGIAVGKLSSLLLNMEFDGLVKSLPGNIYRCLH